MEPLPKLQRKDLIGWWLSMMNKFDVEPQSWPENGYLVAIALLPHRRRRPEAWTLVTDFQQPPLPVACG